MQKHRFLRDRESSSSSHGEVCTRHDNDYVRILHLSWRTGIMQCDLDRNPSGDTVFIASRNGGPRALCFRIALSVPGSISSLESDV